MLCVPDFNACVFKLKMADISKEDLKKEIQEILKDADLDNTSAKKVCRKLNCDRFVNNLEIYFHYRYARLCVKEPTQ